MGRGASPVNPERSGGFTKAAPRGITAGLPGGERPNDGLTSEHARKSQRGSAVRERPARVAQRRRGGGAGV